MNAGNPKDWLVPMLRVWRTQYLRIHRGYRVLPDGAKHWDGWPTVTVMGKIRSDGEGAGQGVRSQSFPEVYTREGLLIWRAIDGMPIAPREVLHAKWLANEPVKVQVRALGLKVATYWILLDNAYFYLAGRIERFDQDGRDKSAPEPA